MPLGGLGRAARPRHRGRRRHARGLDGGRDTEQQAGQDGQPGREREQVAVEAERQHDGLVLRGEERDQGSARDVGQGQTQRSAQPGEQQALGAQLRDEAHARRADGLPHGHFTLPGAGARQQQVREVGTGDEQDEARHRQQNPQRILVGPVQRRQPRVCVLDHEAVLQVLLDGIRTVAGRDRVSEDRRGNARDVRRSPGHVPVGLQATDHRQPPGVAAFETTRTRVLRKQRVHAQRHGDVELASRLEADELWRRHADDG